MVLKDEGNLMGMSSLQSKFTFCGMYSPTVGLETRMKTNEERMIRCAFKDVFFSLNPFDILYNTGFDEWGRMCGARKSGRLTNRHCVSTADCPTD